MPAPPYEESAQTANVPTARASTQLDGDKRSIDDFEFNLISKRLDGQLGHVDKLDAKVGALIAALMAAIAFIAPALKSVFGQLLILFYLVPLAAAFVAFRTRRWDDAPNPVTFHAEYGKNPQAARLAVIERMLLAYEANKPRLAQKTRRFGLALWSGIVITLGLMVVRVLEEYHIV